MKYIRHKTNVSFLFSALKVVEATYALFFDFALHNSTLLFKQVYVSCLRVIHIARAISRKYKNWKLMRFASQFLFCSFVTQQLPIISGAGQQRGPEKLPQTLYSSLLSPARQEFILSFAVCFIFPFHWNVKYTFRMGGNKHENLHI